MVEVTCRTVQGRLLLRPSPQLNDLVLGILGRAQARYRMTVHYFVVLSNHIHLLLSPDTPQQLALFMAFVEANLAKEAGRLHAWQGPFWARRYQLIVVSGEQEAQVARLLYLLRHGVKEGLVDHPRDWPGPNALPALVEGSPLTGVWVDRTQEYRLRQRQTPVDGSACRCTETIVLTRLPCWGHLTDAAYRLRLDELVCQVESEGLQRRREQGDPLGRERIQRQHSHQRPSTTKRSPAPLIHAAHRIVRLAFVDAYRAFVGAYRIAADRLRMGDRLVIFPDRAFPPPLPVGK